MTDDDADAGSTEASSPALLGPDPTDSDDTSGKVRPWHRKKWTRQVRVLRVLKSDETKHMRVDFETLPSEGELEELYMGFTASQLMDGKPLWQGSDDTLDLYPCDLFEEYLRGRPMDEVRKWVQALGMEKTRYLRDQDLRNLPEPDIMSYGCEAWLDLAERELEQRRAGA